MKEDIYQTVTNDIIAAIEAGQTADKFQMPWVGYNSMPMNAVSKKAYRGINIPMLWVHQQKGGFQSGLWGTYKQWQEKGAQVRKGEKGSHIVFWKTLDVEPKGDNDEAETRMFASWSVVFNADQVDGFTLPGSDLEGEANTLESVDRFVTGTSAIIKDGQEGAFYHRKEDYIGMPERGRFHDTKTSTATEAYYSTLLHELIHWSGAENRLNREKGKKRGDSEYAYEELIAELGSAMLCATLGITASTRADHAQYIDGWLKALKDDKRFIFSAASQAQKAVDYLMALQPSSQGEA